MSDRGSEEYAAPLDRATKPSGAIRESGWATHHLNQLTADVGRLQEAVDTLKVTSEKQVVATTGIQQTIDTAKGFLICAGIVGTMLLAIIAWLIDKGFDAVAEALAK